MKDFLLDIVEHTVPVGVFDQIRVDGTATETKLSSTEKERRVVLRASMHGAVPEFVGTFGLPNLPLLSVLLKIPEYQEANAKLTVDRKVENGIDQPRIIRFENNASDFKNDFRLMVASVIESIEPVLKFNVTSWPLTFTPSVAAHQRLKYQISAIPDEKVVTFRIENGDVKAIFGDSTGHTGNFIFYSGVDPKAKETVVVPLDIVNSVLSLSGDKTIHMGGVGMMISIDSGIANYDYIIPMLTK